MSTVRIKHWWLWIAAALTVLKLWLTRGQPLVAVGLATHDDRLFVELAAALMRGNWLGPYHRLTLAKGPFYSMCIVTVSLAGLPLKFTQQLAYVAARALVVIALSPITRSGWAKLGMCVLLLWNPMSFHSPALSRVLRQSIYAPLAVVVFAGLITLYTRRTESTWGLLPWAAALGFAFAAVWLTREESIWIVRSVILLGAAALHRAWRNDPFELFMRRCMHVRRCPSPHGQYRWTIEGGAEGH